MVMLGLEGKVCHRMLSLENKHCLEGGKLQGEWSTVGLINKSEGDEGFEKKSQLTTHSIPIVETDILSLLKQHS